jgi:hypothetical protein
MNIRHAQELTQLFERLQWEQPHIRQIGTCSLELRFHYPVAANYENDILAGCEQTRSLGYDHQALLTTQGSGEKRHYRIRSNA